LKCNTLPVQAVANSLQLDDIPEQLNGLSTLECTLISKRIPFMKILALPRGKQKAIRGCVVNVPVNPEETYSILPHLPSSTACITAKLKRKIEYRGHVMVQHIKPWKIMAALQHLKKVERNPHFEDIVINEHWQKDCWADDEQLWEALTAEDTSTTEAVHVTPSTSGDNDDNTPDEVESSDDICIDDEIEDHTELTGLQFDSCLQPKDLSADKEFLLNLAPGERKNLLVCFLTNTTKRWHFPPFSHLGHLDLIVIARKKYP
jgi:hypothetical protein